MSGEPLSPAPALSGGAADRVIHGLAARQRGVVGRGQLVSAGISAASIDRRLAAGWLLRLHRAVYRVGPISGPLSVEVAAIMACGESAALSHRSAATLWQALTVRRRPVALDVAVAGIHRPTPVDVTVTRGNPGGSAGIRVHRSTDLTASDVRLLDGIAITTPERTLLDLSCTSTHGELELAVAQLFANGLTDAMRLRSRIARSPRRPGVGRLRRLLDGATTPVLTRSEAEQRFLALIRKARIRPPEVNVKIAGYEVDFLWRTERMAVEIDGFAFHSSRRSFERDRDHDRSLAAVGVQVIRITWNQLVRDREVVLVQLAGALDHAARR